MVTKKIIYSDVISEKLDSMFCEKDNIKVLEAGCGSASHLVFPKNSSIVGIDISSEQLEQNESIDENILGDIQTFPLPLDHYNVVVCWNVIEHLPEPIMALKNLFQTLKIGGILILAYPNLFSLKGLVTKFSPYWFHNLYYRLMGFSSKPFPTYLRFSILPSNIKKIAISNGFSVEFNVLYGRNSSSRLKKHKIMYSIYIFISTLLNCLTLFRYDFMQSECIMILKKINT